MADFTLNARVQYSPRGDLGRFIEAKLKPGIAASVAEAQGLIVEEAQRLCPVRTGALRDSIHAEDTQETGKTVVGNVVADAPYAAYVEFGTGIRGASSEGAGKGPYSPTWPGMEAQPFLRPALDATREAVRETFHSNLSVSLQR